jgi:hypothetical protein
MPNPQFENLLALATGEVLTPTRHGPDNPEEIYVAVGYALTMWESLEEELSELFLTYLGTINPAASRAYGSIVSGQGRVGMLKEVIESVYRHSSPSVADLHTRAMTKIGALAGRRNEIAHGIVSNPTVNRESFGFCLFPPSYNSSKNRSLAEYFERMQKPQKPIAHSEWLAFYLARGKYVYTHIEILRYAEMFRIAMKDVQAIRIHQFMTNVKEQARQGNNTVQYLVADDTSSHQTLT